MTRTPSKAQSQTQAGSTSCSPAATTGTCSCRPRAGSCAPGPMTGRASWRASAGNSAGRKCRALPTARAPAQPLPCPALSLQGSVTVRNELLLSDTALWKIALHSVNPCSVLDVCCWRRETINYKQLWLDFCVCLTSLFGLCCLGGRGERKR